MKLHFYIRFIIVCLCFPVAGCMTDWCSKQSEGKVGDVHLRGVECSMSDNLRSLARILGVQVREDETDLELMSDMRLLLEASEIISCRLLSEKTIDEVSRFMELEDEKTLRANEALLRNLQGKRILILSK